MKGRISWFVFFGLLLFFLYEAGLILAPFFGPLLCALATAIVCYPLHQRVRKLLRKRSATFQAFVSDLGILLFLVVPAAFLVTAMISEVETALPELAVHGTGLVHNAQHLIDGKRLGLLPASVLAKLSIGTASIRAKLSQVGEQLIGSLAHVATGAARNLVGFVVDGVIFLILLFFLFKDGDDIYREWNELLPFSPALKNRIHERIRGTVEGVVRSAVIIGLVQGFLFLIGYLIIGFPAAVLFSCLTGLASLLPGIGSAVIWLPLAGYYLLTHSIWKAFVLLGFGLLTGVVDSFIRPWIVGRKAEMPFVWLMFGVLGGLEVFGAKGLILGPLVFSLLPVLLEIYKAFLNERNTLV